MVGLVSLERPRPFYMGVSRGINSPRQIIIDPHVLNTLSGEKYSSGVKNRTSTLLEQCLAKICKAFIMFRT